MGAPDLVPVGPGGHGYEANPVGGGGGDLEVRLPLRPGRGDLVGDAELESEPAVVGRVAEQGDQRLAEGVGGAQDGVHEGAAGAVPLPVGADGQRAEGEDGVRTY